jgi:hypothetical protein
MYPTVLSVYKYAPNLESLLTQQYVCILCTLWSDNTCAFTRFHSVKNANTQLIWSSVWNKLLYENFLPNMRQCTSTNILTPVLDSSYQIWNKLLYENFLPNMRQCTSTNILTSMFDSSYQIWNKLLYGSFINDRTRYTLSNLQFVTFTEKLIKKKH